MSTSLVRKPLVVYRIDVLRYERLKESEVLPTKKSFLVIESQGHSNIVLITEAVSHSS